MFVLSVNLPPAQPGGLVVFGHKARLVEGPLLEGVGDVSLVDFLLPSHLV